MIARARHLALGGTSVVALAVWLLFALVISPDDSRHGDAVRLLYLHVPTVWIAYLAFAVTAAASALYLWPRTRSVRLDHLAGAAAEFGVVCTGLTLFVGSVWGREAWGTWWQWEARLVTTAVMFFIYLGYLSMRRLGGAGAQRRNAIAAVIAVLQVPVVHFSVTWWRSIHQEGSVFNEKLDVNINDATMQWTLWLGVLAFTLLFAWSCRVRMRISAASAADDESALDAAIRERIGAVPA